MTRRTLIQLTAVLMTCIALRAQISLTKEHVVYLGCAAVTTSPATLDEAEVRRATPEWRIIEQQQVDLTSARGRQLVSRMNRRIREAVRVAAVECGCDLVTRAQDVADHRGRDVADLTTQVASLLSD